MSCASPSGAFAGSLRGEIERCVRGAPPIAPIPRCLDERILLAVRVAGDTGTPIGPAWVEKSFRDFTGLGGVAVLGLLTAATLGYLGLQNLRRAAIYLLVAIGSRLQALGRLEQEELRWPRLFEQRSPVR